MAFAIKDIFFNDIIIEKNVQSQVSLFFITVLIAQKLRNKNFFLPWFQRFDYFTLR